MINNQRPKITVIQLGYDDLENISEGIGSIAQQTYPIFEHIFIDNNSSDDSSEFVKKNFPKVRIVRNEENLGFAKANNIALEQSFKKGVDFCLLINTDIKAEPNMIEELIKSFEEGSKHYKIGLIQPTILLYDKPDRINTIGNTIHYLGFGYCKDFNKEYTPLEKDLVITFASGAGLLVSKEYYEDVGGFDEEFFMYHEDLNLGWRGLLKGYTHLCSAKALMYHKYEFGKGKTKFYHAEKNRIMVLFENYSLKTLLLLLPIIFMTELMMLLYSLIAGWPNEKIKAMIFIFSNVKLIAEKRKAIQFTRTKSDRLIINYFDALLNFEGIQTIFVRLVNIPFYVYYRAIKFLI